MNAIAAPKSPQLNRLEGFTLTAIFQGLPTFAIAVLMLKLTGLTTMLMLSLLAVGAVSVG
jgi:hypothetical protein